jgi:hypothetical protein
VTVRTRAAVSTTVARRSAVRPMASPLTDK